MSFRLAAGAAGVAIIALPVAAGAQVLMEPNVSAKMALTIAEAALAECGSRVSVAVVDRAGRLRVFVQGDGAAPHNLELARRKAYTAAVQRVSTGDYTKRVSTPGAFNPGMFDSQLATGPGGIKVGEDTIGGIAVSGAPGGDKDEACAIAGIDKIKDRLN